MKLKELESLLARLDGFTDPKIHWEQYETRPHIAAHLLHHVATQQPFDGTLSGMSVVDLGCGTGRLGIGAALLGADMVLGIDVDSDALRQCRENLNELSTHYESDEGWDVSQVVDLLQMDLAGESSQKFLTPFHGRFDIAILNPPFGTKDNQGVDMHFLKLATQLATHSVYSLHKTSTRDHVLRKVVKQWGHRGEAVAQLRFDLPATYRMHRKASVDIEVDLIRVLL